MRINIIGNGFDLYHGLPSSYYYFGCFLAKNYFEFYIEMAKMYGFSCLKPIDYEDAEIIVEDIFWKTFEESLGELDYTWMEESLIDDLGLECNDPIDIEIPEEANSEMIKEKFGEWIRTTVNTKKNYNIIKKLKKGRKFCFKDDDYFINFNYTQTLEEIYKISPNRIFYIHGKCEFDEDNCDIVVGHRNNKAISRLEEKIKDAESELDYLGEQGARNRLNEYKCECSILKDLKKDVESLLRELDYVLKNKDLEVDEIKVWGLSCGDVDKPYLEYLRNKYPNAKWEFSYYDENEKKNRKKLAGEIDLEKSQVSYFKMCNSNGSNILNEIITENGIEEL